MYLLFSSDLLTAFGFGLVAPLLQLHLLGRGLPLSALAGGASLTLLVCLISGLPAGMIADRYGCRVVLQSAAVLQVLALWRQLTASNPGAIYQSAALAGIALALFSSAKLPLLSHLLPSRRLASTLALLRGLNSLVGAAGGGVAALLCARSVGRPTVLWLGTLLVGLSCLPLLWLPDSPHCFSVRWLQLPTFRRDRDWRLPLAGALMMASCSLLTPYASLLLARGGCSDSQIAISFAVWQALGWLAWPVLAQARQATTALLSGALLTLGGCALLLALPLPRLLWWSCWLPWQLALVLGQSLFPAALLQQNRRAVRYAKLNLLQTAAAMLGTALGGALLAGPAAAVYGAATATGWLAWLLLPRHRQHRCEQRASSQ